MHDLISRQVAINGFYEMASNIDHLCTVNDYGARTVDIIKIAIYSITHKPEKSFIAVRQKGEKND